MGVRPSSLARSSVISSTAAAPSEICDELPAVCTPSGRATGFSVASFSSDVSRRPSSRATRCVAPVGVPSSPRSGASTGTHWPSKRPSAHARAARSCDARPKRSVSSRVTLPRRRRCARRPRTATSSRSGRSSLAGSACRGRAPCSSWRRSGSGSSPRHRTPWRRRRRPPRRAPRPGWWPAADDPHCVSTVVAGVPSGSPAASHAVRVTLKLCSPTWLTHPPTTCPTSAGSMPVRATSSLWTRPSRARRVERRQAAVAACRSGVRTASTITTDRPDIEELMLVDGNGASRGSRRRGRWPWSRRARCRVWAARLEA